MNSEKYSLLEALFLHRRVLYKYCSTVTLLKHSKYYTYDISSVRSKVILLNYVIFQEKCKDFFSCQKHSFSPESLRINPRPSSGFVLVTVIWSTSLLNLRPPISFGRGIKQSIGGAIHASPISCFGLLWRLWTVRTMIISTGVNSLRAGFSPSIQATSSGRGWGHSPRHWWQVADVLPGIGRLTISGWATPIYVDGLWDGCIGVTVSATV